MQVLSRYFPETLNASPTVGRQGKALRRKQQRILVSTNYPEETIGSQPPVNSNLDVKCCGAETGDFLYLV